MVAEGAIQEELKELIEEETEMNMQRLPECKRCHSAIRSNTYTYDANKPVIIYSPPTWCSICNSVHWQAEDVKEEFLPTEEDGILCLCKYPGCGEQFWNRPEWFLEQEKAAAKGNPWMPELIDKDPTRLKRLEDARIKAEEAKNKSKGKDKDREKELVSK